MSRGKDATKPDRFCMAIATETALCGKPARPDCTRIVIISKSFVPVHLCAKHGREKASKPRGGK